MDEKFSIYLRKLKFKDKYYKKISSKYLTNIRLVMLLLFFIIPVGIVSFLTLPRRLNPEIKIPLVIVSTILPGASPEEIENLVTIPIEDVVKGIESVETYGSTSQENASIVTIEFSSDTDPDEAKSNVSDAISSVNNLPDDVFEPEVFGLDFENQPIINFSITSNTGDVASLIKFSDDLKKKLESDSLVQRVEISGTEKQEIQILIKPEDINNYRLNPFGLSQQIKASLNSYPSGNFTSGNSNIPLSVEKTIESTQDIRDFPIISGREVLRLSDVATITERSAPNQLQSYIAQGEADPARAVTFSVFKSEAATIQESAERVKEITDEEVDKFGDRFGSFVISSSAELVDEQFASLNSSFILTLVLVFIVLFIFLGLKQSIIVSVSIPITFLISFIVMKATGTTLNFLSVFSILLALGLLVDDAIVIVSAMTQYFKTKKFTADQTGILVWKDFIVPIWSTTITTVWAFIPLLLATGIIGEFIKTIPLVVSTTLIASTAVAVLITLPITMILFNFRAPKRVATLIKVTFVLLLFGLFILLVPKDPMPLFIFAFIAFVLFVVVTYDTRDDLTKKLGKFGGKFVSKKKALGVYERVKEGGLIDTSKFSYTYYKSIDKILREKKLRNRVLIFTIGFALFSYALLPLGFVVNEFFPKTESNNLYISLEMPSGTNQDVTKEEMLNMMNDLKSIEDVEIVVGDVGRSFGVFGGGGQTAENISMVSLVLVDKNERENNSIDIAKDLRAKFEDYSKGKISVIEESGGPPVGADIQIKYLGEDLSQLDGYANETIEYLEGQPGVTNIDKSIKESTSKLSFIPDEFVTVSKGVGNEQLGFWLRTFVSGFTLSKAKIEGEEKEIVLRMNDVNPPPEEINKVTIPTAQGVFPIESLGELLVTANPTQITREDGKRTLSISATVESGFSIGEVNSNLENFADTINLPEGYEWKTGGVNEENQNSVNSILQAMLLSSILILATMVIQLGSFRKSFIVFLVIPLAISGVFVVFALTGTPLSFPALIGVLALFGIVINNSILVVEKINQNLKSGIKFLDAIADASSSRVEPIMLSSLTTIFGLIPITLTDPLWRGLGGAIISGLLVSGIIMLFFIPVVYYNWFRKDYA